MSGGCQSVAMQSKEANAQVHMTSH